MKKYTPLPIGHAAFIGSLEKGEELLRTRTLDLVGYGRMQLADQGFVKKSVVGEKINKCIWCSSCLDDLFNPAIQSVYCTVNQKYKRPKTIEKSISINPFPKLKHIKGVNQMKTIKLIAIDIDGILLEDTFSPIIRKFVSKFGVKYSRELERKIFSRPQKEAAEYLAKNIRNR